MPRASVSPAFPRAASRRISPRRRIRASRPRCPYIGVQSFKWALDNGQWRARIATIQGGFDAAAASAGKSPGSVDFVREFYARVVPGIDGKFDGPAMLAAIAPRPLLVVNGDSDANTPIAGVRLSVAAAKPLYEAANAADKLQLIVQENTPHRVNPGEHRRRASRGSCVGSSHDCRLRLTQM